MKFIQTNRYSFIFLLIAGLGMTSPCFAAATDKTTTEEIKQETRELLQALKSYGVDQRDEAIAQARAALRNLDKRIETLENRINA